jgi:hypothetical protein
MTWTPVHGPRSRSTKEKLVSEVVEDYVALHPPLSDGRVVVKMVRLEAHAEAV